MLNTPYATAVRAWLRFVRIPTSNPAWKGIRDSLSNAKTDADLATAVEALRAVCGSMAQNRRDAAADVMRSTLASIETTFRDWAVNDRGRVDDIRRNIVDAVAALPAGPVGGPDWAQSIGVARGRLAAATSALAATGKTDASKLISEASTDLATAAALADAVVTAPPAPPPGQAPPASPGAAPPPAPARRKDDGGWKLPDLPSLPDFKLIPDWVPWAAGAAFVVWLSSRR